MSSNGGPERLIKRAAVAGEPSQLPCITKDGLSGSQLLKRCMLQQQEIPIAADVYACSTYLDTFHLVKIVPFQGQSGTVTHFEQVLTNEPRIV